MTNRLPSMTPGVTLSVRLGELELSNPMIAASGTFGWGLEFERVVGFSNADLGAIVLKGTTLEARSGNASPRIVETAGGAGILNSIGLENPGVRAVIETYLPRLKEVKSKVIANVAGSDAAEYCEVTRHFNDCEVIAAIEVNVSCPNVKEGGMAFGCDARVLSEVVSGVRGCTEKPLIVKLTPNVSDIRVPARAAVESGADILSLVNTLSGIAVDVRTRRPILGNVAGGLSGPAIKPVALARVLDVHRLGLGVPIIGMGGIVNAEDALEFMITGARAFSVGTIMFRDPSAPAQILKDLVDQCEELGVSDINDVVGTIDLGSD